MNVLKSSWPRIAEFWFDEPLPKRGVDVAVLRQFSRPVPNAVPRPFHSIEIDLQTPEETLLKAMDADTRYEIRRAETKDQLEAEVLMQPSEALRQEFLRFHGAFAAEKNLQPATPALLDPLVAAGMLCLTRVLSQGEPLVWHSYVIAQGRARLLHSASLFRGGDNAQRNLVGRANRWLHWRDMMAFQSQGLRAYDMGGWYEGTDNAQLLAINRFKQGFGGVQVAQFNATVPLSWLGRLYIWSKQLSRARPV